MIKVSIVNILYPIIRLQEEHSFLTFYYIQGRYCSESPRVRSPPSNILLNVEQIYNYKRGSSRYPRLENLDPPPRNVFSVTAMIVFSIIIF